MNRDSLYALRFFQETVNTFPNEPVCAFVEWM
jgi:hypothetical protein